MGGATETIQSPKRQHLFEQFIYLYEQMKRVGDDEQAKKMYQLLEKLRDQEFVIGFCGHFSAGKSSMINELTGAHLLPSSPIPTSANVVKVKTGRAYARVYFKHGQPVEFPYPYNIKEIKQYCIDGDSVEAVEISHPSETLPQGVAVMDTPGIDSTDDAHRVATESTLHLADIIFYVMDYNHVQSELNFNFTKMLKERGKHVYLVINQIDKHNDMELSFSSFKDGVKAAFKNWNVIPDGIFYTSLRDLNHPHNDLDHLKEMVHEWLAKKDTILLSSSIHSAKAIIAEHVQWLKKQQKEKRENYEGLLEHLSESERVALYTKLKTLKQEKNEIKGESSAFEQAFKEQMQKILKNAILMPFETREHAKQFLESMQANFKVGLFFAKQKTEQEKQHRFDAFMDDLKEKAKAQLDWHMKELIVSHAKAYDLFDESFFKQVYDTTVEIPEITITANVKPQETLTGDYILNYTSDVAEAVKKIYRKQAEVHFERLQQIMQEKNRKRNLLIDEQLSELEEKNEALEALLMLDEQLMKANQKLTDALDGKIDGQLLHTIANDFQFKEDNIQIKSTTMVQEQKTSSKAVKKEFNVPVKEKKAKKETIEPSLNVKERLSETSNELYTVSKTIERIVGMESQSKEMIERADRLGNNRFTIALFGAFSAGKSSFANALMGQNVLPVSPNPTTATINKILPADKQNPHGTVRVKLKSQAQMEEDLAHSLRVLNKSASTLKEALFVISNLPVKNVEPKAKPHLSFLQAVMRGIENVKEHFGQELIVDLDEFQSFVADEEKACFVEWIELHYDCPLTKQGITLVDTPGADSINARHTGVAFEYIKNADAVIFVTYYNHAFSNADREFLIQLGRVKDTFALDKMFFVVNAKDLAADDEELDGVLTHVQDQLLSCGIRNPRLYPVSSQLALLSKWHAKEPLTGDWLTLYKKRTNGGMDAINAYHESGMDVFEQDFISFTINELTDMAIKAAKADIHRSLGTIEHYLKMANEDSTVRQQQKEETKTLHEQVLYFLKHVDVESEQRRITQEINELIYYVKQRIFLRYPDFFNLAFNPSSLSDDHKDQKGALRNCLQELLDLLSFDLAQELRATALRVEKFMTTTLQQLSEKLTKQINDYTTELQFLPFEPFAFQTAEINDSFSKNNHGKFTDALTLFKNGKHFFEQNGKQRMRETLEELLQQPVSHELEEGNMIISRHYETLFVQATSELLQQMEQQTTDYFTGKLAALSLEVDIRVLEDSKEKILQIVNKN